MTADLRVLPTDTSKRDADRAALLKFFAECQEKAGANVITGMVCITETPTGYEYTRIAMTYEAAIGLHTRGAYKLNQDWDAVK